MLAQSATCQGPAAMDVQLAKTFLQVVRTGSLVAAAAELHVTQTAVTARIKNLEQQLGCRLFVRDQAGTRLTANGEKFLVFANQIVEAWGNAVRTLPLPDSHGEIFRFGAETSLANPLVLHWTARLRATVPDMPIRSELGDRMHIQQRVRDGLLDAALVFEPEYVAGMQVEEIVEEKLVRARATGLPGGYVYVDWGPEFRRRHDLAMPEQIRSPVYFDFGPTALQYVLSFGGEGYFRTRVIRPYLEQGTLELVKDSPEFSYPIFAVYAKSSPGRALGASLEVLRTIARGEVDWSQRWDIPALR